MKRKLRTVMLVDDNEADNYLHQMVIDEAGVADQIITARNGKEALEYIKTMKENDLPKADLIFLDINMPKMDGWEFLEEYNKLYGNEKSLVIIMLTTSLNPDDKVKAGKFDQLQEFRNKPLTENVLMQIVQDHFNDKE